MTGALLDVVDALLRERWRVEVNANQLAGKTQRAREVVAQVLSRLKERGWVTDRKDIDRVHWYTLTAEGARFGQLLLQYHHPAYTGGPLLDD